MWFTPTVLVHIPIRRRGVWMDRCTSIFYRGKIFNFLNGNKAAFPHNKGEIIDGMRSVAMNKNKNLNSGRLKLPRLVRDGMVLQRDAAVKIWGWAEPGASITVEFLRQGMLYRTVSDEQGIWSVVLNNLAAGGPFSMVIESGEESITLEDILVGDVWVCGGQSNMQLPMQRVKEMYPDEAAEAAYPEIRQFTVPERYDFNMAQQDLEDGSWLSATPEHVLQFSAAGYFFAKSIYEQLHVPIGLLQTAVGGSPVEAWVSEEALRAFPEQIQAMEPFRNEDYLESLKREENAAAEAWYTQLHEQDLGLTDPTPWFDPDYDASSWQAMALPGDFSDVGLTGFNGSIWLRKEVSVPKSMLGQPARLWLGTIVDSDTAYVNGIPVGTTAYQYPPRLYDFPGDVLREGINVITIRVVSNNGNGGLTKDKPFKLTAGEQAIPLEGKWHYKIGAQAAGPLPETTFIQWKPLGLYNGMIAPLASYSVKGVIWYQGESNAAKPKGYYPLFTTMIRDWRRNWEKEGLPFLFVQLANFMQAKEMPSDSEWAELREAQLQALSLPHTGMAVAIDIGEWNDIHPLNKKDVGLRLAAAAAKVAYGRDVVHSGPLFQSMEVTDGKAYLVFTHTGSGLVARGDRALKHFAIAGADRKFVWAKAEIVGGQIVVWSDQVSGPTAVRYAWADNPEGANLYNLEGLPASPFRTDDW
jgi:sialate O-acetylesterase